MRDDADSENILVLPRFQVLDNFQGQGKLHQDPSFSLQKNFGLERDFSEKCEEK